MIAHLVVQSETLKLALYDIEHKDPYYARMHLIDIYVIRMTYSCSVRR